MNTSSLVGIDSPLSVDPALIECAEIRIALQSSLRAGQFSRAIDEQIPCIAGEVPALFGAGTYYIYVIWRNLRLLVRLLIQRQPSTF
jgi:hypothetical protein